MREKSVETDCTGRYSPEVHGVLLLLGLGLEGILLLEVLCCGE